MNFILLVYHIFNLGYFSCVCAREKRGKKTCLCFPIQRVVLVLRRCLTSIAITAMLIAIVMTLFILDALLICYSFFFSLLISYYTKECTASQIAPTPLPLSTPPRSRSPSRSPSPAPACLVLQRSRQKRSAGARPAPHSAASSGREASWRRSEHEKNTGILDRFSSSLSSSPSSSPPTFFLVLDIRILDPVGCSCAADSGSAHSTSPHTPNSARSSSTGTIRKAKKKEKEDNKHCWCHRELITTTTYRLRAAHSSALDQSARCARRSAPAGAPGLEPRGGRPPEGTRHGIAMQCMNILDHRTIHRCL